MADTESAMGRCPSCSADLPPNAVVCIHCGWDLRSGCRLTTVVEYATTNEPSQSTNPYESPTSEATPEKDKDARGRFETGIARGRVYMQLIVVSMIVLMLGPAILAFAGKLATAPRPSLATFPVRVVLLLLWCYYLYQGGTFSKWFTVVVLGISSVVSVWMIFFLATDERVGAAGLQTYFRVLAALLAVRAVAFGAIALTLTISPSVDDFRWSQQERAKRKRLA